MATLKLSISVAIHWRDLRSLTWLSRSLTWLSFLPPDISHVRFILAAIATSDWNFFIVFIFNGCSEGGGETQRSKTTRIWQIPLTPKITASNYLHSLSSASLFCVSPLRLKTNSVQFSSLFLFRIGVAAAGRALMKRTWLISPVLLVFSAAAFSGKYIYGKQNYSQ